MVIQAIRQAGLNRYRIRDALAEMKNYSGITGEIIFDDVYSDRGSIVLVTVRKGKFIFNEPKPKQIF
jgi:ABC-type branched-subunit amino acid transport system substrate-binding protein